MSYQPNKYGLMIVEDPAQAFQELQQLFQRDKSINVVSSTLGVDRHTVALWVQKLVKLGLGDPRIAPVEAKKASRKKN